MSLISRADALKEGIVRPVVNRITRYKATESKAGILLTDLSWRQWLVLFIMGALVVGFEVRSHTRMWLEHESKQTIWTDPELIWEIVLFGLVIPILGGVFLGYVGRTAIERDKMARERDLRRTLVNKIYAAQNWQELVEVVVKAPDTVASADHAWLLAQRSAEGEFDQVAYWEGLGSGSLASSAPLSPAVCGRCAEVTSLKGNRISTCSHPDAGSGLFSHTRHCLWLQSTGMQKTALVFDVPLDRPLDPGQMKMLDDLGDEMSLAIDNANLQYLEQRQVDVARNERLRIARDLHDTLGQNISYLRLRLEQLSTARLASNPAEFQDELANMLAVADEAYEQVRDTLEELRTTEHHDLEESIRLYAGQVAARAGFCIRVHSSKRGGTLSPRQSRQLMYIVREILNNVEKHAGAQNVDIHLHWRDDEFKLTARDDGKGFDPQELNRMEGYGMAIMEERSRAINANLAIESAPGCGSELALILPLSSSAPAAPRSQ